jgi:hypothetical protein
MDWQLKPIQSFTHFTTMTAFSNMDLLVPSSQSSSNMNPCLITHLTDTPQIPSSFNGILASVRGKGFTNPRLIYLAPPIEASR